jgi:uncharacterized phage protein (TIGR01671 family)
MNRQIKFRGKRIDNGEFVYGYYFTTPLTAEYNIEPINGAHFDSGLSYRRHVISNEDGVVFEVIPDTVGQFTGVLNINGKEIYEGDIICAEYPRTRHNFIVIWDERYCRWNANNIPFNYMYNTALSLLLTGLKRDIEIIGNIHDNSELLTTN